MYIHSTNIFIRIYKFSYKITRNSLDDEKTHPQKVLFGVLTYRKIKNGTLTNFFNFNY